MSCKFTWQAWNFDGDGDAYVIHKDLCQAREDVPDFIAADDWLDPACKPLMVVEDGWCKYQVRTDWENCDGEQTGGYYVTQIESETKRMDGRRKPGWFPVWIIRQGDIPPIEQANYCPSCGARMDGEA